MPTARVNGIRLHYEDSGSGFPVVLLMGTGGAAATWQLYQIPGLTAAGYRTIAVDNRGIPPTDECADGFTIRDMVEDVIGLVEHLRLGSCRLVGTSLGARIAAEVSLRRPDLVRQAVLMAATGREDRMRIALAEAEHDLREAAVRVPVTYRAAVKALTYLSPATLADDTAASDWLQLFELFSREGPGVVAQQRLDPFPDRLSAFRRIAVPVKVVSFADDLLAPAHLGAELAEAIPGAQFDEIADCGHCGYLERPEAVNRSILEFFGAGA